MATNDVWVLARFVCKEGMAEEVKKHLKVLINDVRKEHGCRFDDCIQDAENPLAFTFVEHWETAADFDAHVAGAPAKRWAEQAGHLIAVPVDIKHFNSIWH
jgi:quinol monooxygenase YgiN